MMSSVLKALSQQPRRIATGVYLRAYSSNTEVPTFETLAVSVPKPNVFHVELNRPKKMNSFNYNMWIELQKCFCSLSDNPECRVVVISGQGKHFTAGIDLHSMVELSQKANEFEDVARKSNFMYKIIGLYQDGITSLERCVKPVLAVSHSACVGAGVDLLTAADIRYCTQDSWFQVKEVDIGLAADVGTLQRLPKVIGNTSLARELCFTARKFDSTEAKDMGSVIGNTSLARELCFTARKFDSTEAKNMGFVSQVLADRDSAINHALTVAEDIAKKSPVAVQTTKKCLVYSQSRTNEEGLEHIRLINQVMLQSEDLSKAAMAQAMKSEPPEFENL